MKETILLFVNWLLDRLSENSTWRGIILTLTSAGIVIDPDQANKIIAIGLLAIGVINVIRKAPPSEAKVLQIVAAGQTAFVTKPGGALPDPKAPTATPGP